MTKQQQRKTSRYLTPVDEQQRSHSCDDVLQPPTFTVKVKVRVKQGGGVIRRNVRVSDRDFYDVMRDSDVRIRRRRGRYGEWAEEEEDDDDDDDKAEDYQHGYYGNRESRRYYGNPLHHGSSRYLFEDDDLETNSC
jgi:hypothetical protein